MGELYAVRSELEGLAARLAAQHAAPEELTVLKQMVEQDWKLVDDPVALARANRRFHRQVHLASHNRYLIDQLEHVHRAMALLVKTTLAEDGRSSEALEEHQAIVDGIEARDGERACAAIRAHISQAYKTRLTIDIEDKDDTA